MLFTGFSERLAEEGSQRGADKDAQVQSYPALAGSETLGTPQGDSRGTAESDPRPVNIETSPFANPPK